MNDLKLNEIAQAVAMTMVSDLYDSCGDTVSEYVCRPDVMGAYELEGIVKDLTDDEAYDVIELTKSYLESAYSFVADLSPSQPTLF